jgi:serpin B
MHTQNHEEDLTMFRSLAMGHLLSLIFVLGLLWGCTNGGQTGEQLEGGTGGTAGSAGGIAGIGGGVAGEGGAGVGGTGGSGATGGTGDEDGGTSVDPEIEGLKSDAAPETDPRVTAAEQAEFAAGNTRFALAMYREVAATAAGGNMFFSPYSISVALAMTYAGAENETEKQMAEAMHFTLPEERLHTAFNRENRELNARGEGAAGADGKGFRLNVVNSIWGQKGYPFLDPFLDVLAVHYGAGLLLLDFASAPDPSREIINTWVEEKTEERIVDLLQPGTVIPDTRLVLVNAVYFNAAWLNVFAEEATMDLDFHTLDGSTVQVPTMQLQADFPIAHGDGYSAVELPYDGEELSMVILLPDAGQFEAFEAALTIEKLGEALGGLSVSSIFLSTPRWDDKGASVSLKGTLRNLGMTDAFMAGTADFSGMDGTRNLVIGDVIHQAFIKVNEKGTEAAAATAVVMNDTSMPPALNVDRPFIYLIRDIATDTVLFMGRVTDPS